MKHKEVEMKTRTVLIPLLIMAFMLFNSAAFSQFQEINVRNGGNIPSGGVYDFETQILGSDTDVILTIENLGAVNLNIAIPLAIVGTNADQFSIETQPGTAVIAPGGNTTFTVRFSPTASSGKRNADIFIGNNDGDENPYHIALEGVGVFALLTIESGPDEGMGSLLPREGVYQYTFDEVVNISATAYLGTRFLGWEGDVADPDSGNTTVTMDASKTVRAVFAYRQFPLTMDTKPDTGGTTTPPVGGHWYNWRTRVPINATPAEHFFFDHWEGNNIDDPNSAATTVTVYWGNTVTAHFERFPHDLTVAVNLAEGGTTDPSVGVHTYGEGLTIDLNATPNPGYRFTGWTGDVADPASSTTTVFIDGDKTVTANFERIEHTLTMEADPDEGGITDPTAGQHTYFWGTTVDITATPAQGYRFSGWTGDVADADSPTTTILIDGDKTATANFERIEHTLTLGVAPDGSGTTDPAAGQHTYFWGTTVDISATPNDGFRFTGWTGDVADPNDPTTTVLVDGDKTVTAQFEAIPEYTLTIAVTPEGGGTTNPAVGMYAYEENTVVDISATPNEGFRFTGWTGDVADPNDPTTTVLVDGDKTVTAQFEAIPEYTLTMAVTPEGGGTTNPAVGMHAYVENTVVDISATPAEGFHFTGWTGDAADPESATTTVLMDADKEMTANFEANDTEAPYLTNVLPTPGSASVPKNAPIYFKAMDDDKGVDLSTLNATVGRLAIVTDGVPHDDVIITTHSPAYSVLYTPSEAFEEGDTVQVHVTFADLALTPNAADTMFSFIVGGISIDLGTVSAALIDEEGGSFSNDILGVGLNVPPGALDEPVWLSISQAIDVPPLPAGYQGISLSYHFGPDGIVFNDSVTIQIPYTEADLINAEVTDPADLDVFYFYSTTGEWTQLTIDGVDTGNQLILVKVDRFCCLTLSHLPTDVEDTDPVDLIPTEYRIYQNYPNPFNPETTIRYEIPEAGRVILSIYDQTGRRVRILEDAEKPAGSYDVVWDGKDDTGELVSSGMYIVVIKSGSYHKSMKAVFMK